VAELTRVLEKNFEKKQNTSTPLSGASAQEVLEPAWVYWKNLKFLQSIETPICEESDSSFDETVSFQVSNYITSFSFIVSMPRSSCILSTFLDSFTK